MDKRKLDRHKKNKKELKLVDDGLQKLYDQLEEVPVVMGKVTGSSHDFPYTEIRTSVQMQDPKVASEIRDKIREKEKRREKLQREINEVVEFIEAMSEGIEKEIFEMIYLEDYSQQDVADIVKLERSGISKKINKYLKLSQHSHF